MRVGLFKMEVKFRASCLVLIAALVGCAVSVSSELIRTKRQAQQDSRPGSQDRGPSVSSSSAASMVSSTNPGAQLPSLQAKPNVGSGRAGGQARPARPNMRPPADENFGLDQDEESSEMAPPPPPRRKRPPMRQRPRADRYHDDRDEDEDCDDYRDYGNMFQAAFRPMRQMGDMMGDMFEHMQSLASGDFESLPSGGNYAVASARSDGSGYSRQSSIVNNNGKRRGIISETRNGRTQTRRIGDDDDDE